MANKYFDWVESLNRLVRFDTARSEDVNAALDDVSAGLELVELDTDRALKLPSGTSDQTLALGAVARANKAVVFDSLGNISVSTNNVDATASDAAAAAASASAASSSASSAATSASNAATSASAASTSATNAANSASDAATTLASKVTGPASATDNAIARFDATTGKLIQNSTWTIDDTGNATVAGTGVRFQADFSNATIANRFGFQTSTANENTIISASPNGTAVAAVWQVRNSSNGANASTLNLSIDGSSAYLNSTSQGIGTILPLAFQIGTADKLRLATDGTFTSVSGAIGYGAGAGGTVTQATSKATAVTLNKPSGQITMNNAALAAGASVGFSFFNSYVGANDNLLISIAGGVPGGAFNYQVIPLTGTSGVQTIYLKNTSGGSLSEAVVLKFEVIKGATA